MPLICWETNGPDGPENICYKGAWVNTNSLINITYASFQGIQYAQSPVGDLRFKLPLPYNAKGINDASNVNSNILCPQYDSWTGSDRILGQEDCLFLNVYIPENAIHGLSLPVLFWIHGGSLVVGSGRIAEQGPRYFMETEQVIVVTVNYRLGALGFLSMGTEDVPGNAGLRDQLLALKWVKDNIGFFGGDPEAITIAGESAGGFSVLLHILSPQSEGLFKRAIIQSGCVLFSSRTLTPEDALKQRDALSESLGCDDSENVLKCLQTKSVNDFVYENVTHFDGGVADWSSVPDKDFTSDPYLPGRVEDLLMNGQFNRKIEIIYGTNSDEGIFITAPQTNGLTEWNEFRESFPVVGTGLLFGIVSKSEITYEDLKRMHKLVEYYFEEIDNINEKYQQNILDMFTDSSFQYCTYQTIKFFLLYGITVYQYRLTYNGKYSTSVFYGAPVGAGVCHSDDLIYLWEMKAYNDAIGNVFKS